MNTNHSYLNIEVVDHVPTDTGDGHFEDRDNRMEIDDDRSPNNKNSFSENDEFDASDNKDTDEPRVPLPPKRKACFFLFFSGFVSLYVVFFLVIAYTYPLKPEVYIQKLYLPVFDKSSDNITQGWKDSVFFQLRFNNRNELISVSYDDFPNITIYYLPNTTTSIYFANTTIPGFYQHKGKPVTEVVRITALGLPGLMKIQEEFSTMVFQVNLEFNMRFHCRELGKHKHWFNMTGEFVVPLETGLSFEDTVQMYEKS